MQGSTRVEITLDDRAPTPGAVVVADVFVPSGAALPAAPIVYCSFPGGGMTRRYFDLDLPGYSMAAHLAGLGSVVLTFDHFGIGESSPTDLFELTPRRLAEHDHAALAIALERLRAGTLVDGLAPVEQPRPVAASHSAGALISALIQDAHRSFDAMALLGFWGKGMPSHAPIVPPELVDDPMALEAALPDVARARFSAPRDRGVNLVGGELPPDVATALRGARADLFRSVGIASMIPGVCRAELARLDVPVFVGVGALDITGDPHLIAEDFRSATDFTLFVVPGAGHNHNVAGSRHLLWDRIDRWARSVLPSPLE